MDTAHKRGSFLRQTFSMEIAMGRPSVRVNDEPEEHELELSDNVDHLDDEERAELHAALDRSLEQAARGERGREAGEFLAELRHRVERRAADRR